jgi:dTDP-4-amino-4,6-dideoxygalactose transaminase
MDAIMTIAERHAVPVIEDNAHGLFAKWRGKYLGTFGALATQSFHETKNFTCGEGGALLINDASFEGRAEIIREKGTDRSRFFRGQVDKYTWVDLGSSYPLSDLLAAFLFAQLEQRDEILRRRRTAWQYYMDHLCDWASDHGARLPYIPPECEHSYHLFYVIMPSTQARDALIAHLNGQGINSVFHYQPLHLSAMGRQLGGQDVHCPVAEHAGDHLIRLPLFNSGEEYFVRTVEAVKSFEATAGSLRNTCSA